MYLSVRNKLLPAVFLLLFYVSQSTAQVDFSAGAGLNFSKITGTHGELRFGYYIGGFFDYNINKRYGLHTGVMMTTKGTNDFQNYDQSSINAVYIEVPVMAKYRIMVSPKATLAVGLGPYFSYGIAGATKLRVEDIETIENPETGILQLEVDTFKDKVLKRFDAGMGLSFGVEHKSIVASVTLQYGFVDMARNYVNTVHNQNIAMGVVYRFYSR